MVWGNIAGAVAGSLVGKALGGGSTAPNMAPVSIPGVEFQPFTYTGAGGSVTGTQVGDHGYEWSAEIPEWLKSVGGIGQEAAGGLFQKYVSAAGQDPYQAAQEYYSRGLAQLQPAFAQQQIQAQERMFGGGRLGLKLAGEALGAPTGTGMVSPDAFGLGAAQSKALTDLYTQSLTRGQQLQMNQANMLSKAASEMLDLGLTPAEVEQNLIRFAKELETARSNALKQGTQMVGQQETPGSVFAGQLGNIVGEGVTGMFSDGGYFSGPGGGFAGSSAEWDAFDYMPFDMIRA